MNTDAHGFEIADLKSQILLYLCLSVFICGCSRTVSQRVAATQPVIVQNNADVTEAMRLIDQREGWNTHPPINIPRHPAERFLKDLTLVIDPGHGGEDGGNTSTRPAGYKASAAGDKEAFINLRVALLLERFLKDAGANVIMTRHGDETISLSDRAQIANSAVRKDGGVGADLFVSIHHNAGSKTSNYSSVWYHGSVDDNEPDMDLARHLAQALGREMRTQVAKTSPIFSSQLMYAGGFGVLRACEVPAVLCENSFFSNAEEAKRLRDPVYNLREAYALYTGLCEWAYCGRPTQTTPMLIRDSAYDRWRLTTTLDEGQPAWWGSDRSRILRSTVEVRVNGKAAPVEFNELTRQVTAILAPGDLSARNDITIHHINMLKNSNWPQRYEATVQGEKATVKQSPPRRPRRQPATRAVAKP